MVKICATLIPLCAAGALWATAATAQRNGLERLVSEPKEATHNAVFTAPVRLKAAGKLIKVESPGYASPCWADVDGDGKKDLVVGQFNKGKMKVYRSLGDGKFAAGEWLQAEGDVAEVPGVW